LRDLGHRLEQFLRDEPVWSVPRQELAINMARFEWAQIVAFDGPSKPAITPDDILGEPEAFHILLAIARGATVEEACETAIAHSERTGIDWAAEIKEWFNTWAVLGWSCHQS
jgi:hypothetical protein